MNMDDKVSVDNELDKLADSVCVRFSLELVALPDEIPAVYRLRALLKRMKRDLNLKCIAIKPASRWSK